MLRKQLCSLCSFHCPLILFAQYLVSVMVGRIFLLLRDVVPTREFKIPVINLLLVHLLVVPLSLPGEAQHAENYVMSVGVVQKTTSRYICAIGRGEGGRGKPIPNFASISLHSHFLDITCALGKRD